MRLLLLLPLALAAATPARTATLLDLEQEAVRRAAERDAARGERQRLADEAGPLADAIARSEDRGPSAGRDLTRQLRQLENAIHRACILCRGEALVPEDLELPGASAEPLPLAGDLRAVLARVERELIERALREHGGNLTAAGRALGVERNLLRYKLRKHGLR